MEYLLQAGAVVGQRFQVVRSVASGGMGSIYRGLDLGSGRPVAIKLLREFSTPDAVDRFSREARLLSELQHPGIVSYVAHGALDSGQPFLIMDWLPGEDLGLRLRKQPLSVADSLNLLHRITAALRLLHERGIVHRDLNPSNIFLRDGLVERATLLDFGIARSVVNSQALTRTGTVMGTPEYMSPEQAGGQREYGLSVDVFALGCVLFKCLIGQPPFTGEHAAAVLAKILFLDAPRLRGLRPELPEALDELMVRMLSKNPSSRPADAVALLGELEGVLQLPQIALHRPPPKVSVTVAIGADQQLVSVILATECPSGDSAATLDARQAALQCEALEVLCRALSAFDAQAQQLADGSLVVTVAQKSGAATDQVAHAARCALFIKERWPAALLALVTGRGRLGVRVPIGEALDRAGSLLRHGFAQPGGMRPVLLDEVTAGLLDLRFRVNTSPTGTLRLAGEEPRLDPCRPLLGRPTPCVGREQELEMLAGVLHTCIDETVAQAVLILGPPGLGKSRLRHEFLRRAGPYHPQLLTLIGRGDQMSAGSSFGLLRQALRRLCEIHPDDATTVQQTKLRARISRHLPSADSSTLARLSELCDLPCAEGENAKRHAAPEDPCILRDQLSQALVTFLRAECAVGPVLLVLDDMHWSDASTVYLLLEAIRQLHELPFMVLLLGRPEVLTVFPELSAARIQNLQLSGLSKRACEQLIRHALAPQPPRQAVGRMIELAAGNVFVLEELVRADAAGDKGAPPATVLALLQARIGHLSPFVRRTLCAASVVGSRFRLETVLALLGEEHRNLLKKSLAVLQQEEMVEVHPDPLLEQEPEYYFRHPLVREAAYSLLTPEEHQLAHHLVAVHLEAGGKAEP